MKYWWECQGEETHGRFEVSSDQEAMEKFQNLITTNKDLLLMREGDDPEDITVLVCEGWA